MEHSFNVEIAAQYGIHTAILLKNIHFWIVKNRANEKHFHNGRYWTYNSQKAFSELFPYLTERQVKYTIEKMKKDELILIDNFNENPYDKTSWYALTDKALKLLGDTSEVPETPENTDSTFLSIRTDKNVPIDSTKLSHRKNKIVSSYNDTDNKPNNKLKKVRKEVAPEEKNTPEKEKDKKRETFDEIIAKSYNDNKVLQALTSAYLQLLFRNGRKLTNESLKVLISQLFELGDSDYSTMQSILETSLATGSLSLSKNQRNYSG